MCTVSVLYVYYICVIVCVLLYSFSMVTLEIRICSTKERKFWEGSHLGG